MRLSLAAVVFVAGISASAAQTTGGPPAPASNGSAPATSGAPASNTVGQTGNQAKMPDLSRPRTARANHPVKGAPIVKGNNDIYVDSYGELSTRYQP